MGKAFKILSIDGGGIKGLYSSILLREFEKSHGRIVDHFDMICGTSTGGIIALALGAGVSGETIAEEYKVHGSTIFPSQWWLVRSKLKWLKQLTVTSKYDNRALKDMISRVLGDKLMDESKVCLCIPSANLSNYHGLVFKTSHCKDLVRDRKVKMRDVALATSAAPTYLPITAVPDVSERCIDGGIWANNPSLIGVYEALSYFVGREREYEDVMLLSIDNLSNEKGWAAWKPRRASVLVWNSNLFDVAMSCQSKSVDETLKIAVKNKFLPIRKYVRIDDHKLSTEQKRVICLDRSDECAIREITEVALSQANSWRNRPDIAEFFKDKTRGWSFPIS